MKTLYLLRHAQTLPAEQGQDDHQRHLTPKGIEDARTLGQAMKAQNMRPAHVYCSTATRTKETLGMLMEGLHIPTIHEEEVLYHGTRGDYFDLIQRTEDRHKSLLIVAHNPTIHALAMLLMGEGNSAALHSQLAMQYGPATLSVFECACESWADIQPHNNKLLQLLTPQDYNAPQTPARWM